MDDGARKRVCLLEGPAFARELDDIKKDFSTAVFGDVFRTDKIPTKPKAVYTDAIPGGGGQTSYATAASATGRSPISLKNSTPPNPAMLSRASLAERVIRNSDGQRLDSALTYTHAELDVVMNGKFCNKFHLSSNGCSYSSDDCQYKHGDKLERGKREALRSVARRSPCSAGTSCDDADCMFGHRCVRPKCWETECKFWSELHFTNTKEAAFPA